MSLAKIDEAMSTYVRHQTHPLAIKMLNCEDDIPQDATQPLRDYGASFTLCQALALGRRDGLTIVLDKDSQSCPIALAGLGFVRPEAYLSGKYALAPTNRPAEAQKKAAEAMPRFEFGKYKYILISPIRIASFDPDVILFYGNGAQVMRMIQAAVFASGESLTSSSSGAGGCLLPIVGPILEGKCKYTVPGNGERRLGLIADGELAFAMPRNRFEEVVRGLKLSHEGKQTYPISPGYLKLEYKMPPPYVELRKALLESSK
ncbi:MAG: DUF169 domain-containing protein [Deltaproteobacteria bacterium]|nr:MAG: DUF169 domain-containing protein [Deltaproteobacteria bacterium]